VMVWETNINQSKNHEEPSPGNFLDWAKRNEVFDGITGCLKSRVTIQDDNNPEVTMAALTLADFFPLLSTKTELGRTFAPEEITGAFYSRNQAGKFMGKHPVVVISHSLWRRRFNNDYTIVGRIISFEDEKWRVIGVMPPDFALPDKDTEIWIPWDM